MEAMTEVAIWMTIVGCILFVAGGIQYACFTALSKRLTQKMREKWFAAVARQDLAWFDMNDAGEMPGRISSALVSYQTGVGPKFSETIQFIFLSIKFRA